MKAVLWGWFAVFASATAGTLDAAVVLSEDFNDISGPLASDASWNRIDGTPGGILVTSGVTFIGGGTDDLRSGFSGPKFAPLYFGLDIRVSLAAASSYVLGLADSNAYAARFYLDDVVGGYQLGVNSGGVSATKAGAFATDLLQLNQAYRLVGFADGTGTVSAWIDPSTADALTPDVTYFLADVGSFDSFFLRQGDAWDNGGASWTADNLVVATNFSDVVPLAVPEPTSLLGMILVGAGWAFRSRRRVLSNEPDRGAMVA